MNRMGIVSKKKPLNPPVRGEGKMGVSTPVENRTQIYALGKRTAIQVFRL